MRVRSALFLLLVGAPACSDSSGPQPVDVAGRWSLTFLTAGVNTAGYSCSGFATLDLTQNGVNLTGSYAFDGTCTTPHDRRADAPTGAISGGSASGSTVVFRAAECAFEGTPSAAGRISGTMQCDRQAEIAVRFAGSWQGART